MTPAGFTTLMIQFNNKPPKKLIVKALKSNNCSKIESILICSIGKPKIPEEYEASALARIGLTIDAVFSGQPLPYGHEEIYQVKWLFK